MYPVSDAYKTAMKAVEQEHKIYGTIGGISFEERNILRGSLTITNQCSDNEEIKIGQVYIGELKATFIEVPLPRYYWKGLDITVFFAMKLADGSYEEIPLGIFTVSEADWTSSGVVVTAYDNMARFDKTFYYEQQIVGKAYDLVMFACEQCGVTFGMEEDEVLALPNGDRNLSAYFENDIETWRDYLSWLTQTLGCFATIDRDGRMVFRTYGGEPVDVIDDSHRFQGASFSDYETRYTGMSVVNMKTQMTNYYHVTPDDGLTYNLGSNPFLQYGTEEGYNTRRRAVLEALQGIRFVPFKATAIGNPAYDLGDVLVFKNGIADGTKQSCLTKYVFGYNSRYEMQCGGKDPALTSARSKSDKNIAGLISGVKTNEIVVHSYINASAYMIGQEEKTIISINYATTVDTHPIFIATIPFTADRDGYVVFKYYKDEVLMADDTVRQYVSRGDHFVTLSNNMSEDENTRHTLAIKACTEYTESDIRQQSAKIMSFEQYISTGEYIAQDIDTTTPTITIAKNTIRAVLYAQGMARTGKWDGTINISDAFAPIAIGRPIGMFSELMGITTHEPIGAATVTEQFPAISIGTMTVGGISASIMLDETIEKYVFSVERAENYEYDDRYVSVDGSFRLNDLYSFTGSEQPIASGKLYTMTIETDQFASVQSIEVTASGSGKFLISDGEKYYDSSGGEIEISELTQDVFQEHGNDEPPESDILLEMDDPTVLLWADEDRSLAAAVTAVPYGQNVVSEAISLSHTSIHGIENATVACDGALVCAVSVDREVWMAYDGSDWITLSEEYSGMSKEALESLTIDQWAALLGDSETMYLRISLAVLEQAVMSITVNFVN